MNEDELVEAAACALSDWLEAEEEGHEYEQIAAAERLAGCIDKLKD